MLVQIVLGILGVKSVFCGKYDFDDFAQKLFRGAAGVQRGKTIKAVKGKTLSV
jgi:hypothetical protein